MVILDTLDIQVRAVIQGHLAIPESVQVVTLASLDIVVCLAIADTQVFLGIADIPVYPDIAVYQDIPVIVVPQVIVVAVFPVIAEHQDTLAIQESLAIQG